MINKLSICRLKKTIRKIDLRRIKKPYINDIHHRYNINILNLKPLKNDCRK